MRYEVLVESQPKHLALTEAEAESLVSAGRRLASDKAWWGSAGPQEDRSVIRCTRHPMGGWSVRVVDAVGLIAVGELRLEVQPKIPLSHLLYLFGESGRFPRLGEGHVTAAVNQSLWPLVARWYLSEAERLLRKDLLRDYQDEAGWLSVVRGRIDVVRTELALARGRPEALCEYEDFATDTALNRTLREAARRVSGSSVLEWSDRRRAMAIGARMPEVGKFRPIDLHARPDRRAGYYRPAITLARHVIAGQGRSIEHGSQDAWTFLIRTPEMVEDGVRNVLRRRLGPQWTVQKRGRQLVGSTMTLNPDLVFGDGLAVADVKYKWFGEEWARTDLYQVVAFATGFHTVSAALIGFRHLVTVPVKRVRVGPIELSELAWEANEEVSPSHAADRLASGVSQWLSESRQRTTLG